MKTFPIKPNREGPDWTDENGELETPYLSCQGCKHLGVHDYHYFYCGAQDAQNQRHTAFVGDFSYAYPWPGAGKQLVWGPKPTAA